MTIPAGLLIGLMISIHIFTILLIWIVSYRFNALTDKLNIMSELSRGINNIADLLSQIRLENTSIKSGQESIKGTLQSGIEKIESGFSNFKEINKIEHDYLTEKIQDIKDKSDFKNKKDDGL